MSATRVASAVGLAFVATSLWTCAIAAPAKAEGLQFMNPTGMADPSKYYSHIAVVSGGGKMIFIAGQDGFNKEGKLARGKTAQIRQSLSNLKMALEAAGASPADVVAVNVYVANYTEADIGPISKAEKEIFTPGKMPTSALLPVPRLALDHMLFEISAVAVVYPK